MALILTSCEKEKDTNFDVINKYTYNSEVSQNRILLAKSITEILISNPDFANIILSECNQKFDGDRNVLLLNMFKLPLSTNKTGNFGDYVETSQQIKKAKNNSNFGEFTNLILNQDSLVQIYYYICNGGDSISYEGIVIKPEDYIEGESRELLYIKKDGSSGYLRSDIEPKMNYLIISENERYNTNEYNQKFKSQQVISSNTTDGKIMNITQATFTSISAKRTVEDWINGEPEVRVNIIYALINPITNAVSESRNCSFMYIKDWIKNTVFVNYAKWNTMLIEGPFWLLNEKNYGRRLIWTEEDGTSSSKTVESSFLDKTTGLTTKISTTTPSSTNDVIIADSWIDYDLVGEGKTFTWGIIKFDISCK